MMIPKQKALSRRPEVGRPDPVPLTVCRHAGSLGLHGGQHFIAGDSTGSPNCAPNSTAGS